MEIKMIKLGRVNYLKIIEKTNTDYIFQEGRRPLSIPISKVFGEKKVGDVIKGFVYSDRRGMFYFITKNPTALLGEFEIMQVLDVQPSGIFVDWGIKPDLFIPDTEMENIPSKGRHVPVFVRMDKKLRQIIGTTKIQEYLVPADKNIEAGRKCDIIVYRAKEEVFDVIVNQKYHGILFSQDVVGELQRGDHRVAYVKEIEESGNVIVSLFRNKFQLIDAAEKTVMEQLEQSGGQLQLHDKSHPKVVQQTLHMSKRVFKNTIGILYKKRLILIKDDGIYLQEKTNQPAKSPIRDMEKKKPGPWDNVEKKRKQRQRKPGDSESRSREK